MTAQFAEGQEAIWTGTAGMFSRRVRIVTVRRDYLVTLGESPADGKIVYDIADPVIKGTVYGIPGEQLHTVPEVPR